MNAGFDDDEFTAVDVESRGSEPDKQSNDPPPEFTGTKPSEFRSYRKKSENVASFHAYSCSVTGATSFEQVDRPSLGCLRRTGTEDVATADGVEVILDTLAEAFQGEHETELFDALEDTFYGPGREKGERPNDHALRVQSNVRELAKQGVRLPDQVQGVLLLRRANLSTQARIAIMTLAGSSLSFSDVRKACKRYDDFLRDPKGHDTRGPHTVYMSQARAASVGSEEQEGDSDVETALAALTGESDIDLEETDVQEILLAYKESRQLRGEQRVNRGYRPVTGHTSGGKPYRVEGRLKIKELISRARCRICREKGHWARECPNKGKQMLKDSEEVKTSFFVCFGGDHCTPGFIGKGVIDTRCSRFLVGRNTLEQLEQMLARRWCLNTQRVQLKKASTFRFGNDETLETKTLAILPVGIGGVNEYCVSTW